MEVRPPNLKGAHSMRADLRKTDVVEGPFVRDNDGLNKVGLRRLAQYQIHGVFVTTFVRTLTLEVQVPLGLLLASLG